MSDKPSDSGSRHTVTAQCAGRNASERRASLEKDDVRRPGTLPGKADTAGGMSDEYAQPLHRGSGGSMYTRKAHATTGSPIA